MNIHFSSSREKTVSHFSSRISRDRDSCQGLHTLSYIDELMMYESLLEILFYSTGWTKPILPLMMMKAMTIDR